jgi:hypothetical protein
VLEVKGSRKKKIGDAGCSFETYLFFHETSPVASCNGVERFDRSRKSSSSYPYFSGEYQVGDLGLKKSLGYEKTIEGNLWRRIDRSSHVAP